jgi:RNA polymerase primary sigma factor
MSAAANIADDLARDTIKALRRRDRDRELVTLVLDSQGGDRNARDRVVELSMPLVHTIADTYNRPELRDDLIQAGVVGDSAKGETGGLLRAIELFDAEAGYQFSTYAGWWIRAGMRAELARLRDETGQSARLRTRQALIRRKARELAAERNGEQPSAVEVLIACRGDNRDQVTLASVERALGPVPRAVGAEVLEQVPVGGESATVEALDAKRLLAAVDRLPPRRAHIVRSYLGLGGETPRSFRELAAELGITWQRVRKIYGKAIEQVRTGVFR